jgi:hypothetical protein
MKAVPRVSSLYMHNSVFENGETPLFLEQGLSPFLKIVLLRHLVTTPEGKRNDLLASHPILNC